MIFTLFFAAGIGIYLFSTLLLIYADIIFYPHMMCVKMAPHSSAFQDLYQALICGHMISNQTLKQQIKSYGMLHLFVVSGTHLHFISLFIELLSKNKKFTYVFLICYSLSCGLKAPVVRALTSRVVKDISRKYKLGYNNTHSLLFCLLLLLPVYYAFNSYLSLAFSFLASLIVEVTAKTIKADIFKHFIIFLLIGLIFLPLQALHPITFLFTYFMTPIICFLFIPLCALSFIWGELYTFTDALWRGTFLALETIKSYIPNYQNLQIPISLTAFIVIISVSYLYLFRTNK